ncbi:MAG TPA: immunoglobulin domain-containing protein [Candidatus Acidoferrum sp.]|jgi:hypothetical protein|nr:immunoglobulin domain-containing protein [Candidatus Acidoferrum sp.]
MKATLLPAPATVRSFLCPTVGRTARSAPDNNLDFAERSRSGRLRTTSPTSGFGAGRTLHGVVQTAFAVLALSVGLSARAQTVVTDCTEDELVAAVSAGGTVTFSGNCAITLSQPINVAGTVIIDASPYTVTLSGGGAVPLFTVEGNLTLKGMTLAGGFSSSGGALYINPSGDVFATNCTFSGNTAAGTNGTAGVNGSNSAFGVGGGGTAGTAGTSASGGAIYNAGTLTLWNCTLVTNNAAAGNGAAGGNGGSSGGGLGQGGNGGAGGSGAPACGGAVYNGATMTAVNCTFTGNGVAGGNGAAGGAGGSAAFPGVAGNGGTGGAASGAGIYNASNIVLLACTFSGNTSFGGNSAAGGTKSNGAGSPGPNGGDAVGAGLTSAFSGVGTNCTFFDNMVIGGNGGNGGNAVGSASQAGNGGNGGNGMGASLYNASGSMFAAENCTVAAGAAVGGTNGAAGSGSFPGSPGQLGQALGGGLGNRGTFTLVNSLLSTNSPGGNGNGTFIDGGHNLSSDASFVLGATSLTSRDPKLNPLTNNGGPTLTMALRTNSPAIDAVGTNAGTFPATDQRGVQRPLGKGADIGAYELATTPGIITQPQSQAQSFGGSVTFAVDATGASLRYQWQFGSSNIPSATASSYTISSVNITNAGGYRVVLTNSFGSLTSSVATLTVLPYIVSGPTNQEVLAGHSANFFVSAAGSPPLTYFWYFNATNLQSTATPTNLTVSQAQITNAGNYNVVISNSGGSITSAPAALLVDSILVEPVSQTVLVGSNVTLSVVASGTGLIYQWRQNGTDIPGAQAPAYSVNARKTDAGTYEVFIHNSLISLRSDQVTLTVVTPTAIAQPSLVANRFSLAFQTEANLNYLLQYKNTLRDLNWTPFITNTGTGSWLTNTDGVTNQPSRFYRLLIQ